MKYTIIGIILVDAAILAWAWRFGSGADFAMMAFALVCITFFGSMPIVLGALSRRKSDRTRAPTTPIIVSVRPGPQVPIERVKEAEATKTGTDIAPGD